MKVEVESVLYFVKERCMGMGVNGLENGINNVGYVYICVYVVGAIYKAYLF